MPKHHRPNELCERSGEVLKSVVQEYVREGRPVGSRSLSRRRHRDLSPATLRSVMAELEANGYLTQPHTSAGRVPTAAGYRFYVESLLGSRLPNRQAGEIRSRLETELDPADLMSIASQLLSDYSHNIGIVLAPPISQAVMKHIEFVKLSGSRISVVLVSTTGMVRHRLIRLEHEFEQADLDRAARYLVCHFAGHSLVEIRKSLLSMLAEEQALYNRLTRNAVVLGSAALSEEDPPSGDEPQVFVGGTSQLIQRLEGQSLDLMARLFQTLEQKARLVEIISECLDEAERNPSVTIGLDRYIRGLEGWSLIASPYTLESNNRGTVGILGPSRMEYEKAIGLVNYVTSLFNQLLHQQ